MTVLRRQLAQRLRQLRRVAGKTEGDVAEAGLVSRVTLWRIETAKVPVKVADVRGLCWLYGAGPSTTDMLARWALAATQPGWWEDFDEPLSTRDGLYPGLEAAAQHLYTYDVQKVSDLLQTPDYTRAEYLAVKPNATESAVRGYVKHQQGRQAALAERTPPLRLTVVLDEAVLARPVGGTECLRGQVRRLEELSGHVHVDLRYILGRVGDHPAMRVGGFTVVEFTDPGHPDVVYLESHTGARYLERPAEVTEYRRIFAGVYALSAPISERADRCQPASRA